MGVQQCCWCACLSVSALLRTNLHTRTHIHLSAAYSITQKDGHRLACAPSFLVTGAHPPTRVPAKVTDIHRANSHRPHSKLYIFNHTHLHLFTLLLITGTHPPTRVPAKVTDIHRANGHRPHSKLYGLACSTSGRVMWSVGRNLMLLWDTYTGENKHIHVCND